MRGVGRGHGSRLGGMHALRLQGGGEEIGERERYMAPWLIWGTLSIPAVVLHSLAGGVVTLLIVGLVVLSTGAVAYAAWHGLRDRPSEARIHTLSTLAVLSVWIVLATVDGFVSLRHVELLNTIPMVVPQLHYPAFLSWLIVGPAVAATWTFRSAQRQRDIRDHEVGLPEPGGRERPVDPYEVSGLEGTRGGMKKVNAYREEGIFQVPPGNTLVDFQSRARMFESAQNWAPNSFQLVPAPEFKKARVVRGIHMLGNPLEHPPVWPGLQVRRGMTLFDPIPVGIRANGDVAYVQFVAPEGGLHALIMGMTGAGKSFGCRPELIYKAALGGDIIMIDIVKGIQSFRSIAGVLQMYETQERRARAIIDRLRTKVLPERTNFLADRGLDQWVPGCGLKFLFVHIEEAWSVLDMDEVDHLAFAIRSAGGQLTLSLQRSSGDQMSPTLLNQLAIRRCFGTMDEDDAAYALSEKVLNALGEGPDDWQNTRPGMQIVQAGGLDVAELARPVRSFTDQGAPVSFTDASLTVSRNMSNMCSVTARALGSLWDSHVAPLDLVTSRSARVDAPRPTAAVGVGARALGESASSSGRRHVDDGGERDVTNTELTDDETLPTLEDFDDDEKGGDRVTDELVERLIERESRGGDGDGVDPWDVEIGDVPEGRAGVKLGGEDDERQPVEEFNRRMERRLDRLVADDDVTEIEPSAFGDVMVDCGYGADAVLDRFDHWASEAGGYRLAKRGDGTYVAAYDADEEANA